MAVTVLIVAQAEIAEGVGVGGSLWGFWVQLRVEVGSRLRSGSEFLLQAEECVGVEVQSGISECLGAGRIAVAEAQADDIASEGIGEAVEGTVCGVEGFGEGSGFGGSGVQTAEGFGDAGVFLGGHGNEAPFVGIGDGVEGAEAGRAAVGSALDVGAGGFEFICAADGADLFSAGAGDADFFFDTAVDFADEVGVGIGADHVGVGFEAAIGLAGFGAFVGVSDDFGAEDAGGLGVGFGVMVEDARDADKEFAEGIEGS